MFLKCNFCYGRHYCYHRLLCHSLVRSVILLSIVELSIKNSNGFSVRDFLLAENTKETWRTQRKCKQYDDMNYLTMKVMHIRGVYPDEGRAQCKLCNGSSIVVVDDWFKNFLCYFKNYMRFSNCCCIFLTLSSSFSEVRFSRMLSTLIGKQNGVNRCG